LSPTGQIAVGMAYGIGIAVAAFMIAWAIIKIAAFGRVLVAALSGIPKLIESNQRVSSNIELLISIITGQQPVQSLEPEPQSVYQQRPSIIPQRPVQPVDTFTPVSYEATEDETEVYDTSEADLMRYEEVEGLKERGYSVEEDLDMNPPGVTRQA
jgi:hypothetical protein